MLLRRKEAYKFSDRKHSIKGILSFSIGILSGISLLILIFVSSLSAGNGSLLLGMAGIACCGITVAGFFLGMKACKDKEIYYTAPVAGLIINGIVSVVYLILYMLGASL